MTAQEKVTLEELVREFRVYKQEDIEWKTQMDNKVKPLVDDRLDHMIISKYGKMAFKASVSLLGAIATVLIIAKATGDFLKR